MYDPVPPRAKIGERVQLKVQPLTVDSYAPFGRVIGAHRPTEKYECYETDTISFWHQHIFDPGVAGKTELLWVRFKPRPLVLRGVECHLHTEQAIIPVDRTPLVHVVAPPGASAEDITRPVNQLCAFMLDGNLGVCMNPGVWHAQLAPHAMTTHLMITRRSTTIDLLKSIQADSDMRPDETLVASFEPPIQLML